jgi:hypothetical protein
MPGRGPRCPRMAHTWLLRSLVEVICALPPSRRAGNGSVPLLNSPHRSRWEPTKATLAVVHSAIVVDSPPSLSFRLASVAVASASSSRGRSFALSWDGVVRPAERQSHGRHSGLSLRTTNGSPSPGLPRARSPRQAAAFRLGFRP